MAEHLAGSEAAFVERMNQRAQELGMNDTNFVNCTGLDDDAAAAQHRTSAHDIAIMSRELLKHPDIKKYTTIWMDSIRGGTFGLSNTNKLVRFYPGCTGLKTGFTSGAGYCLSATAEREGMELIAVVMGCETSKIRNAACKQLLDYGFANYAVISPLPDGETAVEVKLGEAPQVSLLPGAQPKLLIDKGLKSGVTTDITLSEAVTAPVAAGQELGKLTVRSGEKILAEIPLVAAAEVRRLTWGQLFRLVMQDIAMGS
jgi:D-alanyl-D-alanine carboxypeptidase (penicillin-binding protein 5/6)